MTDQKIKTLVNRATGFVKSNFPSFIECVWNENEKCLVYSFRSHKDAEAFKLHQEVQGSPLRMVVEYHHANWSTMCEYRP